MATTKRVVTLVVLTGLATALMSVQFAGAQRANIESHRVVPQVITLPAPKVSSAPVANTVAPVRERARVAPVIADMAGTDVQMGKCPSGGAQTKLGMMENSAVYGHCGAQP